MKGWIDENFLERVNGINESEKTNMIRDLQKKVPREPYSGPCVSCFKEVEPPERAQYGYKTCITCARLQERERSVWGKSYNRRAV